MNAVFEKPSLRTRVSFETAFTRLGGNSIFLRGKDVGMGVRESVADFARVISQYVDVLAVRTFAHSTLEELAEYATIPVVNALSDDAHPCQAMADMLTLTELKGELRGVRLAFIGDGNNVAMSLAEAAALLGVEFVLACPEGYEYPEPFARAFAARFPGSSWPSPTTPAPPPTGPTPSTPTSGPAWGRRARPTTAARSSPPTRSTRS